MNKEKELVNKLFKNKSLPKDELNTLVSLVKKYDKIEAMLDTIVLANMDSYFMKNNKENEVHIKPFAYNLDKSLGFGKDNFKESIINSLQTSQIVGCLKTGKYRMDGKEFCDIKFDTNECWSIIINNFLNEIKYGKSKEAIKE